MELLQEAPFGNDQPDASPNQSKLQSVLLLSSKQAIRVSQGVYIEL